jgi:cysteine synthase A
MSRERFDWLASVAGEVIKTPGSESNVKEIFDKCKELRRSGQDVVVFNQFDEFGNYLWHHGVTGPAGLELLELALRPGDTYRGFVATTGSAGTLAAADFLKTRFPAAKIAAAEALQCPTLLSNGFGAHRIEGIGDKHVPWIHNVRNTDLVIGIDDEAAMSLIRLFNEPAGRRYLVTRGLAAALVEKLPWLGLSSAANLLAAVKFARYFELGPNDVVLTVLTDSMEMYGSRLSELTAERGELTDTDAAVAHNRYLLGASTDFIQELTHTDRRRVHNLKYYTWVEQQGKTFEEIQDQWYGPTYWSDIAGQAEAIDVLINEFNAKTGLVSR